jgi:hypothetical protein
MAIICRILELEPTDSEPDKPWSPVGLRINMPCLGSSHPKCPWTASYGLRFNKPEVYASLRIKRAYIVRRN